VPSHVRFIDFEKNMLIKQWITIGVLASAAVSLAAKAQQVPEQPNPLDANAPVSASTYTSAFKNYQAAADEQVLPDKAWRAANDEVGKLGGHMGHIKSEAAEAAAPPQSAPVDHGRHH
jgi:hypothetical protein